MFSDVFDRSNNYIMQVWFACNLAGLYTLNGVSGGRSAWHGNVAVAGVNLTDRPAGRLVQYPASTRIDRGRLARGRLRLSALRVRRAVLDSTCIQVGARAHARKERTRAIVQKKT